jgi:hypothetical protein
VKKALPKEETRGAMAAAAGWCSSCVFDQCCGCGSDPDFFISDPGSKKAPDPGSATKNLNILSA